MKHRPRELLDKAIDWICIILVGAFTSLVILTVLFRYILSMTAVWSEELVTLLFIASSFIGCAMAARNDDHISVDFIFALSKPRGVHVLKILVSLLVIIVQAFVFRAALTWIGVAGATPSPGLEIPFYFFYSLLPISSVLVCVYEVLKITDHAAALRKGGA